MAVRTGHQAVWMRRRKGGNRSVTEIAVAITGETVVGTFWVRYVHRGREVFRQVQRKNLKATV